MKKKSRQAKKAAAKKADPKRKVVPPKKTATKKAVAKKATPKKAAPKKATRRSMGFRDAAVAESFRPICVTENKRLAQQCMTESEAFEIAQAHRRNTSPHHRVDIESC